MAGMNHDYDRPLVVSEIHSTQGRIADLATHLGGVALGLEDVTGHLVGSDAHAWHTDNAADTLQRAAQQLEDAANELRRISGHVLYPKPDLKPEPSSMLDGLHR